MKIEGLRIRKDTRIHLIYLETCTGTYTYTTAQTRLKNICAHTTRTCIHAHSPTNVQLHIHPQICSRTHSLAHIFSLSLTLSLSLFVTTSPYRHMLIHYLHSHTITRIYGLTRSCALLILFSHTYTHTRAHIVYVHV